MIFSTRVPEINRSLRLVILHPLPLYAEAIHAVIHRSSPWQIIATTTDTDAAVAAARDADAILFDTRWDTAAEIATLARRLREDCPGRSLVLLTRHEGVPLLRAAAGAGINAVVHLCESVPTISSALAAVACGNEFRSPVIAGRLARAEERRRQVARPVRDTSSGTFSRYGIAMGS